MKKPIVSAKGAPPLGPYTPAILASGPTLYISAQGPIDPETGKFIAGAFREQAILVLENITSLLEAGNTSWDNVVKVTLFLEDMANFAEFNELYAQYVTKPYPARTVAQSNLTIAAVAVDCIALVPDA